MINVSLAMLEEMGRDIPGTKEMAKQEPQRSFVIVHNTNVLSTPHASLPTATASTILTLNEAAISQYNTGSRSINKLQRDDQVSLAHM